MTETDGKKTSHDRPVDVTVFGILFLLSAPAELYNIIRTGWMYQPKFFGIMTAGLLARVVLAAQPLLHAALGYGFLTLRRWAVYLALFYAADTLTSAVSSFILHGYGRFRTIFIVFLVPFVIYVIARRRVFTK
jgi:uncharacterized membrane protein (DUF2068 family)